VRRAPPGLAPIEFLNASKADPDTQAWVPTVEDSWRSLANQTRQGKGIAGTLAVLARLDDHSVDSRGSPPE
jgi:hypothetical protein